MPATLRIWSGIGLLLLCAECAQGQFVYFDKKYDSGLSEQQNEGIWGSSLFAFDDGYLFISFTKHNPTNVTGSWLVRTDLHGDTVWTVKDVDPQYAEFPKNMVAAGNGGYAYTSTISDLVAQTPADISLTVVDEGGDRHWKMLYGTDSLAEVAAEVMLTSDNGFAIIGQRTIDPQTDADMYLVRTDSEGSLLWEQQYGGNNFDGGYSLVQTPDGGFLLLGWTRSFGAGQRDFYLVKTDNSGNQEWQRTYGGNGDEIGQSIVLLSDGNYLLTGSGSQGSSGSIGRKYKVDSLGNIIWSKTYGYPENSGNNLWETIELWNGDLVSAGMTNNLSNAGWLVRTDSQGNVIWQREYDYNSNTDLFYTLIATSDGGFLLGGQAKHDFPLTQDAWLLKVDSVGCTYADCLVGVDELNSSKVVADVWPNPASESLRFRVQSSMLQGLRIMAVDMQGRAFPLGKGVAEGRGISSEGIGAIDVSHWPNGLYVLTFTDGKHRASVRVTVQH